MNILKNAKISTSLLTASVVLLIAVFGLAIFATRAAITGSYLNEDLRVQDLGEIGGGLLTAQNGPAYGLIVYGGLTGFNTTTPAYTVHVDGTAAATAFVYTSDQKLKKNVATLDNALDKILQLRGVSFNWIADDEAGIGLIAQEVEKVFPELVTEGNDTKAVQYGNLVAPLIEAVKEQQAEIDSLTARIKKLEATK